MKSRHYFLALLFLVMFSTTSWSQDMAHVSRIKIYATKAELLKLRKAGVEFEHGVYDVENSTFINEFEYSVLAKIKKLGYKFDVLVDDVFRFTDSLNRVQDPYMKANNPVKVDKQYENLRASFTPTCTNYDTYVPTVTTFNLGSRGGFYTLNELDAELADMVADHPTLVSRSSAGNTLQGRPIWVVKISDNASANEGEPEMLYTGMNHAREGMSMMNLIYYMRFLLENYNTNPKVKELVDNRALYFIPVVNIDGFNYNTTLANWNAGRRMRRKNMRSVPGGYDPNAAIAGANADGSGGPGVDPNRNYGMYWGAGFSNVNTASSGTSTNDAYRGTAGFSEPETAAIRDFVNAHNFTAALNYHCYGNWWIRPEGPDPAVYPAVALAGSNVAIYNSLASLFSKYNCFTYGTAVQTVYDVNGYSDDWLLSDPSHSPIYAFSPEIGDAGDGFWCPQADIIPYAKQLLFPNLQAAYTCGSYVDIQDNSPAAILTNTGTFSFTVTRKGFVNAPITVTLVPLTPFTAVGPTVNIASIATFGGTSTGTFTYNLGSITAGSVVGYNLVVQTGGMTFTEQITKIYSPTVVFEDDMNTSGSFATKYVATGSWGYQATNGMLSTASLTESPAGNYANSADNFIKLANPLNLSSCTQAYLEFMIKYNSENCMDRMQLEISTTGVNGAYTPICTNNTMSESKGSLTGNPVYTGLTDGWIREIVNLSSYIGNNNVGLRLHFLSNGTNSVAYTNLRDGFNLDNIQVIKTNAISLPVTFEDINAVREGDKIRVNWKAHFDTHFGRYEIQRSGNGVDFYTIGTESDPNTSTFLDKTPLHGYNYYRIKAYDLDESYKASKIVSLVFENSAQFTVYPNPVNNVMNVEIVSESGGKRGIVIIDMSGQVVEKKDVVVKQGYNVHQLEVSKLASQTYVVQLRDESGVVLKTIKVLKR